MAESNFFGSAETQRRVPKLEALQTRGNLDFGRRRADAGLGRMWNMNGQITDGEFFDDDLRLQGVGRHVRRVNDGHALCRREPEPSAGRLARGRLESPRTILR